MHISTYLIQNKDENVERFVIRGELLERLEEFKKKYDRNCVLS